MFHQPPQRDPTVEAMAIAFALNKQTNLHQNSGKIVLSLRFEVGNRIIVMVEERWCITKKEFLLLSHDMS